MTFFVGQKVVCIKRGRWIDAALGNPTRALSVPKFGAVYTVREIRSFISGDALYLEEITNAPQRFLEGVEEPGWAPERFRPVTERKTSIEIFERMLTPKRKHATASA